MSNCVDSIFHPTSLKTFDTDGFSELNKSIINYCGVSFPTDLALCDQINFAITSLTERVIIDIFQYYDRVDTDHNNRNKREREKYVYYFLSAVTLHLLINQESNHKQGPELIKLINGKFFILDNLGGFSKFSLSKIVDIFRFKGPQNGIILHCSIALATWTKIYYQVIL